MQLQTKEQIFYTKQGKPKSVLLDYKIYEEMLNIIEDIECVKIIEERKKEKIFSEDEAKNILKLQ